MNQEEFEESLKRLKEPNGEVQRIEKKFKIESFKDMVTKRDVKGGGATPPPQK